MRNDNKMEYERKYPVISACGLDCGLCPAFYAEGISRCPGCCGPGFSEKHPSCPIITCCVKKHGHEICCDCTDFPCKRYEKAGEKDSFITYRNVMKTFMYIKKHGIKKYVDKQEERITILRKMLSDYNDGRSKSFFCLSAALLSLDALKHSLTLAGETGKNIDKTNKKALAKCLKGILKQAGEKENVELRLRRG